MATKEPLPEFVYFVCPTEDGKPHRWGDGPPVTLKVKVVGGADIMLKLADNEATSRSHPRKRAHLTAEAALLAYIDVCNQNLVTLKRETERNRRDLDEAVRLCTVLYQTTMDESRAP